MNHPSLITLSVLGLAVLALGGCQQLSEKRDAERIARLEARLADAERRIELVEARGQIENLQRAYGYYLDKALYEDMLDLFTDDVQLEYSGRGVYVGKERARILMQDMPGGRTGLTEGTLQNHLQLQGVVHVAPDGTTAKGRWRALIQTAQWQKGAMIGEGPYEMEYRKENGVWKISRLHWYVTYQAPYEKGPAMARTPFPGVNQNFPPDLSPTEIYDSFPAVYVPPFHYDNPVSGRPASRKEQVVNVGQ